MGLVLDTSALVALEHATARLLGFAVLVGPQDEEHFGRVEGITVRTLKP